MTEFGPQRTRHVSLCEALDSVLNTGVVALGEVTLSVADVDLIYLGLQLVVTSVEGGREIAPMTPPSQLDRDPRGSQRLLPGEEMPARPPASRPPIAALPLALADQASPRPSDTLAEKTELIASAIADSSRKKNGLGQLVLTLIKVLHELLKRQAIRRIEGGSLTPAQIERLGVTLMQQAEELERLRKDFGLPEEDLNLDLGPLGKLL
ncbi:MAG: gas vesicle protein GvpJ [Verrucomicrobiota bacterium]